jgi:hypothetical protein
MEQYQPVRIALRGWNGANWIGHSIKTVLLDVISIDALMKRFGRRHDRDAGLDIRRTAWLRLDQRAQEPDQTKNFRSHGDLSHGLSRACRLPRKMDRRVLENETILTALT